MHIIKATIRIRPLTKSERIAVALRRLIGAAYALDRGYAQLRRSTSDASDAIERFKTAWGKVAVKS